MSNKRIIDIAVIIFMFVIIAYALADHSYMWNAGPDNPCVTIYDEGC